MTRKETERNDCKKPLPPQPVQDLDPLGVKGFWEEGSCGEVYARSGTLAERLQAHSQTRYQLEPYILEFGCFADAKGKDVLEIGVGMGDDHERWAEARPRRLIGIDLTQRAVSFTAQRRLQSFLCVTNAEALPFSNSSFDIVYSWGVLHHTPNTEAAIAEVHRVLRRGGVSRIMFTTGGLLLSPCYGLFTVPGGSGLLTEPSAIFWKALEHVSFPDIRHQSYLRTSRKFRFIPNSVLAICYLGRRGKDMKEKCYALLAQYGRRAS